MTILSTYAGLIAIAVLIVVAVIVVMYRMSVSKKSGDSGRAVVPSAVFTAGSADSADSEEEIVAVIAAAVASLYEGSGTTAVIRCITPSQTARARSVWAAAGVAQNTRAFLR